MKKLIYTFVMMMALVLVTQSFAKTSYKVSGVVNINTASKTELVLIPGIGESKAATILQQRGQKPFSSKEDLLAIKGIGEKILSKISSYIVLRGNTTIQKVKIAKDLKNPKKSVN